MVASIVTPVSTLAVAMKLALVGYGPGAGAGAAGAAVVRVMLAGDSLAAGWGGFATVTLGDSMSQSGHAVSVLRSSR